MLSEWCGAGNEIERVAGNSMVPIDLATRRVTVRCRTEIEGGCRAILRWRALMVLIRWDGLMLWRGRDQGAQGGEKSVSDGARPTIAALRLGRQIGTRALKNKSWLGETQVWIDCVTTVQFFALFHHSLTRADVFPLTRV